MALLAAGAYLGWNGWLAAEQANVAQARNELQKMGLAMSIDEILARNVIPDGDNAAPYYERAFAAMTASGLHADDSDTHPTLVAIFQQVDAQRHEPENL